LESVGRLNQLRSDPQPVSRYSQAAFQYEVHAQLVCDLANVDPPALKGKRRCPRSHSNTREPGKRVNEIFREPIGKIIVIRAGADIHQRQHCYRVHLSRLALGSFRREHSRLGDKLITAARHRGDVTMIASEPVHARWLFHRDRREHPAISKRRRLGA
jgi:hypothetical protein